MASISAARSSRKHPEPWALGTPERHYFACALAGRVPEIGPFVQPLLGATKGDASSFQVLVPIGQRPQEEGPNTHACGPNICAPSIVATVAPRTHFWREEMVSAFSAMHQILLVHPEKATIQFWNQDIFLTGSTIQCYSL